MHAQKWWQRTNYHVFHTNWNKACSTINITKLYFGLFYTKMKCSLKQCFYNVSLTPLFHFNVRRTLFCSIMLVVEHSPSYLKQTWARKKQSHEKRERVNFTPAFAHASNENYTRFKRFETCRVTSQSYFQAIDYFFTLWSLIDVCGSMGSHGQVNSLAHVEKHHISCSFRWNVLYFGKLFRIISVPCKDAWTSIATHDRQVGFLTWHERGRDCDPVTCLWKETHVIKRVYDCQW